MNRALKAYGTLPSVPTHVQWGPQKKKKKKEDGVERIFEEIMAKNLFH